MRACTYEVRAAVHTMEPLVGTREVMVSFPSLPGVPWNQGREGDGASVDHPTPSHPPKLTSVLRESVMTYFSF